MKKALVIVSYNFLSYELVITIKVMALNSYGMVALLELLGPITKVIYHYNPSYDC